MEAQIPDSSTKRFHQSTKPHFFQVLIPGFLTKFSIPVSFNKYLGLLGDQDEDDNVKTATLRDDRRQKIWKVKVVGDSDKQRFKDGWEKFCKDHDIQIGDFLVFKHQGNLVFDVSIFDPPTACERELLLDHPNFTDDDPQAKTKDLSSNDDNQLRNGLKNMMGGRRKGRQERKVAFKPSGYPYFSTVVKPHNYTSSRMHIPIDFARANNISERWCNMVLIDEKGQRSWPMLLRHRRFGGDDPHIGGWCYVHKAIGLKIGDHIIFELIDSGEKPIMKFYTYDQDYPFSREAKIDLSSNIVKNAKACLYTNCAFITANYCGMYVYCKGCTKVGKRACRKRTFSVDPTGHPYCRMVVKQCWRKGVYFPTDFVRENGLVHKSCEMVLMDDERRAWPLLLKNRGDGRSAYITGWRPIQEANGLKTGDSVAFELVDNGEKPVMKLYLSDV